MIRLIITFEDCFVRVRLESAYERKRRVLIVLIRTVKGRYKMKKLLIALFIVVFTLSFSVCAEVIESGECGDNLTWTLDDEGTLVISGTGDMWDYDSLDTTPWRASSKKVVLEKGVTYICDGAFYGCTALKTVYYQGTEEDWNRIEIDKSNSELLNANIIFNYTPQEEVTDETKLTESAEVPEEDSDETANATEESNKDDNSLIIVIVVCVTVIVCLCIVAAVVIIVVKSKNKKY